MRHRLYIWPASKTGGFTLLEVLVALAVLAIALPSIFRLQGQTIMMSGSARFHNIAPKLAQSRLAEVERQPFRDIGDDSGDFGSDFPGYTWAVSIEDLPTELVESEKYHLVRITVTVSQNESQTYEIKTYRFMNDE